MKDFAPREAYFPFRVNTFTRSEAQTSDIVVFLESVSITLRFVQSSNLMLHYHYHTYSHCKMTINV